jgi:hypothetical protein
MYLILLTRGEGWYLYSPYPSNEEQKNSIRNLAQRNDRILDIKIIEL